MSESVTLKSYFYEVLIPSSQKNTSSPIEDILHHVSKYIFYEKACALQMFQSTHPHGVRLDRIQVPHAVWSFNPRTHTGYDVPGGSHRHFPRVSIHAPTRGTTYIIIDLYVFLGGFNPRTHTGYDQRLEHIVDKEFEFQSTHPHGVRPWKGDEGKITHEVSIHAPTRGTTG